MFSRRKIKKTVYKEIAKGEPPASISGEGEQIPFPLLIFIIALIIIAVLVIALKA